MVGCISSRAIIAATGDDRVSDRVINSDPQHTTLASRIWSGLLRVRVTVAYSLALAVVALALLVLGPVVHGAVVSDLSTNLYNLARGHIATLVGSAFVTDGDDVYVLLPPLVCLLALGELVWRGRRLVLAFAVGHIGATLIVAAGLAIAVGVGWLPISVTHASDVGISYGAAGVLGALTAVIPPRWRPAWIGWWLGIALFAASGPDLTDFTAVGHMLALMLGMALSVRMQSPVRWTPARVAMLAVGVAFGYLLITGSSPVAAAFAGPAGVLVALVAQWAAMQWRRSSGQDEAAPVGGNVSECDESEADCAPAYA